MDRNIFAGQATGYFGVAELSGELHGLMVWNERGVYICLSQYVGRSNPSRLNRVRPIVLL